jgi:hypothetical protein
MGDRVRDGIRSFYKQDDEYAPTSLKQEEADVFM